MPGLSDLVPFHSGQVRKLYLLVLGCKGSQYNFVFHFNELNFCMENSVDPGSTLITREFIYCCRIVNYKLIFCFGRVKLSLDKYIMAIYLFLDKLSFLLFPHPCVQT